MMLARWAGVSRPTTSRTPRGPRRGILLQVEALECRTVPTYFNPAQVRHAYGFDQITFGSVAGDGTGQTIAIVDAYDNPKFVSSSDPNFINSDLHHFDASGDFGFTLSDPVFTKVDQSGGTNYPAVNAGWSSEIALDVEWAHAIAPGANILLVEANSNSFADLLTAVDTAANYPGVSVVSMSWGGGEFSGESSYDSHFSHPGITFVASSGDSGTPPEWPAISANVLAVGGTTLTLNSNNSYKSETGWRSSGGGISTQVPKPDYQTLVSTSSTTKRTSPDVAYNADPNTGVLVYDSVNGGWFAFGGTSAGAPQWAALVAIADQGRGAAGSLDGATQTLYALYKAAKADYASTSVSEFHDITSGRNGPGSAAKTGYDTVTGIGTPMANQVVAALVAWTGAGNTNGSFVGGSNPQTPPPAGHAIAHSIVEVVSLPSAAAVTITQTVASTATPPASAVLLFLALPIPTDATNAAVPFTGSPAGASTSTAPTANSQPAPSTAQALTGYTLRDDAWTTAWLFESTSPFGGGDVAPVEPAPFDAAEDELELTGVDLGE